jgi:small-conductance mechanosensitive channel
MKYLLLLLSCLLTIVSLSQDSLPNQSTQTNNTDKLKRVYVLFEGDTLFLLSSDLGPYTAEERANAAEMRLYKLADELTYVKDSFNIIDKNEFSLISYSNQRIISISNQDATVAGLGRQEAAEKYVQIIHDSFVQHIEKKSFTEWMIRIGLTLLTLFGLVVVIFLLNRLFKWINRKLLEYEKRLDRKKKSIFRYLAPKGPEYFFIFISNIVKYALIILFIFLYLPLMFSFLPWTKGIVEEFYSYILDPVMYIVNGLYHFLPNLFYIAIIIIIARYVLKVLSYISREIEDESLKVKGFHRDWAKPTLNIAKIIIYAFALVFMFPYLPGSESEAFKGVTIFLGILLSLGSTSAIANIVAGIVITYMRPFMVGDRVKIGNTIGDVVEKSLLVTKIKTLKNEDVTIPNATIINTHLWNYTKNAKSIGVILHTSITLGYDVPWEGVNKLLLLAAKNTKNLTREFKPFVLQKSLNDFYVEYELNVYTKQPGKMAHFYSELHKNILLVFNEAGIEILSPHYNAIRDGNPSTIPGADSPDVRNPVEKIIDKVSGKEGQGEE